MKNLFILLFAAAFTACGVQSSFHGKFRHVTAPKPVALKCEKIDYEVLGAVDGFVADSLYVTYTMMHPDHRMVVCNLKTMTPLAQILNVGRGPNEYNYISIYNRVFRDGGDMSVWIFSSEMGRAAQVNLTRSCREQRTVVDTVIMISDLRRVDRELSGSMVTFDVINDSLALYRTVTDRHTLECGIYNYAVCRISRKFDMYDQIEGDPSLAGGIFGINSDFNRVAFVPAFLNQVDYCDLDGSNAFSISTSKQPVTVEHVARQGLDDRRGFIRGVLVMGNRILVQRPDHDKGSNLLHIYDWDGNLLHVLQPDVAMSNISVTDDGVLYGFVSDTEICKADISEYLN